MIIQLTTDEMRKCEAGGHSRIQSNVDAGRPLMPNNCPEDKVWDYAKEGAMGEMAVAKLLGLEWSVGSKGALDVGEYDVRQTKHEDGHLLLQKWDKPRVTILVTGKENTFRAVGYLYNPYGMIEKYWRAIKRPCYWVPQTDLIKFTTMDELEKYRHQCDVRQLLVYHFTDKEKFRQVIEIRGKDNQAYRDFIDQGMKGNRGNQDEWYE